MKLQNMQIRLDHVTLLDRDTQEVIIKDVDFDFPVEKNILVRAEQHQHTNQFLKFIAILCDPDQGSLLFDQSNITQSAYDDLTQLRLKLGYAFDYGGLLSNRTLFDNLLFPLEYHQLFDPIRRVEKVKKLFQRFSIDDLATKKPLEVTGKVRKLLCVLRALIYEPQIIILDDPTLGLSPEMKEDLVLYIKELMDEKIIKQMIFFSQDHFWLQQFQYDELIIDEHGVYYQDLHQEKRSA